jgi:hypothetical protein
MQITVTNGKIVLDNVGSPDRMTKLNYIEISAGIVGPTLSISNPSIIEGNSGTKNLAFTVNLSQAVGQDVTMQYTTANGSAIAGGDYTATSGTLTIPANTLSATINIPIIGDILVEGNETLQVNLSNAVNATIATPQGVGTILNDDSIDVSTKINFQLNGSPTVAGYDQDNGDVYGLRVNGLTYGWNKTHTADDRDRNKLTDQILDTLVQMQTAATWSIAVPNGTYNVKLSVGDAQYTSNNTVNINGVNYWTNLALGITQFANKTMQITVTNGKIVLDNVGSPDRMTKLNYIEISAM